MAFHMRAILVLFLVISTAQPVLARGSHWSEVGAAGDRRHGNSSYGKAKVEERDRLLSKLKDICRGC
jgi:hypothetical protein